MDVLKVMSRVLNYPSEPLLQILPEIRDWIAGQGEGAQGISEPARQHLLALTDYLAQRPLLKLQSEYGELFDRGRSLSLYLFEHTYGESRDRGQAMVDLMTQYRRAGLEITIRELPDHIPLFLEFVSTQPDELAREWLHDMAAVFAVLALRLDERQSPYAGLFHTLIELAELRQSEMDGLRQQLAGEERDDTPEALDRVWEEEMVTFGPDSYLAEACGTAVHRPSEQQSRQTETPINWVDAR